MSCLKKLLATTWEKYPKYGVYFAKKIKDEIEFSSQIKKKQMALDAYFTKE